MTEVIRIGPYDKYRKPTFEGYSESRSAEFIERGVGFPFSFREQFGVLAQKFSTASLDAFEGGCGNCVALKDMRDIGSGMDIEVTTTGVTMARRNVAPAIGNGVDTLVVGKVERYFALYGVPESFHFVLDVDAALYRDTVRKGNRLLTGTRIIPIYAALLKPGGRALLTIGGYYTVSSRVDNRTGKTIVGERDGEIMDRLAENGLHVLASHRGNVLVEKQNPLSAS